MKRYGYLYEKIYTFDNMKEAHRKARRGKSHYSEVQMINKSPSMLKIICDNMRDGKYRTSPYKVKGIVDRGKERTIFKLPYYPDRIAQWAIMLQLEDMFLKTFIYDTYASLPNRGIHKAVRRVNNAIKNGGEYCLKFDIKKFFPSINQDILMTLLERKIKDTKLLSLLDEIVRSVPVGIPIGNYISQWLANYYLSFFDHRVCNKFSLPYFRYMDDIVVFSKSKALLRDCLSFSFDEIEKLDLEIKSNHQVFPSTKRGVDFLGYRNFGDYVLIRKKIARNIKTLFSKIITCENTITKYMQAMISYKGWLEYGNSFRFANKYLLTRSCL